MLEPQELHLVRLVEGDDRGEPEAVDRVQEFAQEPELARVGNVQGCDVRCGVESNPVTRVGLDLDPGVGVGSADDISLARRVVLAQKIARDDAAVDADGSAHRGHRGGEVLAMPELGLGEEPFDRVLARLGALGVEGVGEAARLGEPTLDLGSGEVIGADRAELVVGLDADVGEHLTCDRLDDRVLESCGRREPA